MEEALSIQRTEKSGCEIALDVEIKAEAVEASFKDALKSVTKSVTIPGFRKGKAPISLVKKMYQKYIIQDLTQKLIEDYYPKALEQEDITPIAQGQIESMTDIEEGKGFSFKVNVEVNPNFEVKDYKGIEVTRNKVEATGLQVDERLKALQENQAIVSTVEGKAKKGNLATVDLQKLDEEGNEIEGNLMPDLKIELGKSTGIGSQLDEFLIGSKAGETKEYTHSYPEDFDDEELAGTSEKFKITIKEIESKELPEIDDDFAQDLEEENLESLKANIKKDILEHAEKHEAERIINTIADEILKRNPFDVPKTMVSNFIHNLEHDYKEKNPDQEIDHAEFHKQYHDYSVNSVRWILIREQILKAENLEVTDEEVDAKIAELSEASENPTRTKVFWKTDKQNEFLRNQLLDEKFSNFLKEISVLKDADSAESEEPKKEAKEVKPKAVKKTKKTESKAKTTKKAQKEEPKEDKE
ncbi:MAG: trigger factor [Calditrichaeota bacterium]|nr:MAG: trigger factor [Calditrichota bacterium]